MLTIMYKPGTHKFSRGFSLIELMLAMVIGLIILGGVMSLYVTTRDTQRSSEDQLTLISNANFVIETIADDLRQAGFWGQAAATGSIVCRADDVNCAGASEQPPAAKNDCAALWYINLTNAVMATDNSTNYASTCTTQNYKSNTDVIGIHYADTNTVGNSVIAQYVTYVRSNFLSGGVFVATANGINGIPVTGPYVGRGWDPSAPNSSSTYNYPLVSNLYYVSQNTDQTANSGKGDSIPSLHLVHLGNDGTQPVMTDTMLISGVADLQIQFGVDTSSTPNGQVDSYVNPGSIPQKTVNGVTTTDWSRVHSAKIWVLVRSDKKDRDISPVSQTITVANNTDTTVAGYRYYLMSSVVQLRNNK